MIKSTPIHSKYFQQSSNRREIPHLLKNIYKKPTHSIIFNDEILDVFPLRLETRQGCPLSPFLINVTLEALAETIRTRKGNKCIPMRRKINWLCLQMTWLYMQEKKKNTWSINEFFKVTRYKVNIVKLFFPLYRQWTIGIWNF